MENIFDLVLDKDEKIIKVYKPHKLRTWFTIIALAVVILLCFIPLIIVGFLNDTGLETLIAVLVIIIPLMLICIPFVSLWYKKTVYAVTNKRILIRTGYIGVDYKSLDFTMLGALTVNVSWVDKLIKKNTGTISFGSMASPMTNQAGAKFSFMHITNPYETYKEIKTIIDENKLQ
ncbi:MAG: hypothetical protein IKM43_04090 [Clostridia bacterium]|nr:hypothetical protein [Clostridia bacterium]